MAAGVLSPGDRFADYTVVRLLGAGGFGAVYEAEHALTGRRAALKIIHPHVAEDAGSRARALQEIRALGELSHANIVALEGAGISPDGQVWLATELLRGWTLRDLRARSGPMAVEQALAILAEICDGVAAAHDIRILHRDLKPENVFVTTQMAVKVLDFTAAKAEGRNLVQSTGDLAGEGGIRKIIGTPAYMSPEQLRGERADHRTDIYSVGLIGYELLGPAHPFANRDGSMPDEFELARRHGAAAPRPLPELSPDVPEDAWQVIRKALSKRPEDRQSRIRDLAAELRAARARYLKGREPRAFAKDWRGPGSFATHGEAEPPVHEDAPRNPSRRVVVRGRPAEPAEDQKQDRTLAGVQIVHVTVGRGSRASRRRGRLAATVVLAAACVVVLAVFVIAWRMGTRTPASPSSTGQGDPVR